MTKEQELLPCPFCGGEARLWSGDWAITDHGVVCIKCEVTVDPCHIEGSYTSVDRAIKAWNTRSDKASLRLGGIIGKQLSIIHKLEADKRALEGTNTALREALSQSEYLVWHALQNWRKLAGKNDLELAYKKIVAALNQVRGE